MRGCTNKRMYVMHGRSPLQIQALKNLGYNITRAKLAEDSKNKFFITQARRILPCPAAAFSAARGC